MSKAILQFFLVSLLLGACAFSLAPASIAQEDPNAQYIALVSGELAGQPREIEVPIEVGALRVFFNLQTAPGTTWMILTPTGLPWRSTNQTSASANPKPKTRFRCGTRALACGKCGCTATALSTCLFQCRASCMSAVRSFLGEI
ncbi:MAG: hypothetical protein U0X75_28050 [Acidobacteriota bacterium]